MRLRQIGIGLLLVLAGIAAPGRAAAQDPDSARATLVRHRLCPDEQVQISTTFAERFVGRCVMEDARLLVVRESGAHPILYTAVDSIWVRGPATRPATVTGAWVGAGLGGALGTLFVAAFCEVRCRGDYVLYGLGGAAAGALAGRSLGWLIGREARVWIRLYPR